MFRAAVLTHNCFRRAWVYRWRGNKLSSQVWLRPWWVLTACTDYFVKDLFTCFHCKWAECLCNRCLENCHGRVGHGGLEWGCEYLNWDQKPVFQFKSKCNCCFLLSSCQRPRYSLPLVWRPCPFHKRMSPLQLDRGMVVAFLKSTLWIHLNLN